jgi:hypothetical protein
VSLVTPARGGIVEAHGLDLSNEKPYPPRRYQKPLKPLPKAFSSSGAPLARRASESTLNNAKTSSAASKK